MYTDYVFATPVAEESAGEGGYMSRPAKRMRDDKTGGRAFPRRDIAVADPFNCTTKSEDAHAQPE